MTTQFQIGATYAARFITDADSVARFTIIARTAKTVTVAIHGDKTVRRGLSIWNGVEQFKPFGSYSMCMIVGADDLEVAA